jgi:hypothetical protein
MLVAAAVRAVIALPSRFGGAARRAVLRCARPLGALPLHRGFTDDSRATCYDERAPKYILFAAARAPTAAAMKGATGADADSMSCEERTRAASALLLTAERAGGTDFGCQTNDDCRVVWRTTDCSDNCAALTTRSIEEKIRAAIADANSTFCRGFRAAGCKMIVPPCAPPRPWTCVSGFCSTLPP